jgi:flagella basal body P-ring formation protein FlgA
MMNSFSFHRRPRAGFASVEASAAGAMRALFICLFLAAATGAALAQADEPASTSYDVLPVPAVTIYPGDIIQDAMLTEQHFLPGTRSRFPVVLERSAVIGKVARRTLVPDRLIPTNAIAEPEVVTSGALTRAVFQSSGLSMTASVVALQSGTLGQLIQVRNVDSGRVVAGIVQPDGTVRVGGQ